MYVGIQYLRAFAALGVVFYHISFLYPVPFGLEQAKGGVDVFFVISGFVIATSGWNLGPNVFLWRRVIRIVPTYWLVTLIYAVFYVLEGRLVTPGGLMQSLAFLPYENPGQDGRIVPIVGVGWTLNLEMMFYLIFAVVLSLAPRGRGAALCTVFAALIGFNLANPGALYAGFFGQAIILEFLAGVGLARLVASGHVPSLPVAKAGLLLAVAAFVAWQPITGHRVLDLGLPALLLVYCVLGLEPVLRRLPIGGLLLLGHASYAIYLIHKLVLEIGFKVTWRGLLPSDPWLMWPLLCIASITAGVVLYLAFERPTLKIAHNLRKGSVTV